MQGRRQIVWASQNPSKPCSKMLCSPEVVKTNDIAQTFNQTIQVQPLRPLPGIQLRPVLARESGPFVALYGGAPGAAYQLDYCDGPPPNKRRALRWSKSDRSPRRSNHLTNCIFNQ